MRANTLRIDISNGWLSGAYTARGDCYFINNTSRYVLIRIINHFAQYYASSCLLSVKFANLVQLLLKTLHLVMEIFRSEQHAKDFDVYKEWSKEKSWDLKTLQLSSGKSRFEIDACQVGDLSIWHYFAGARMFDQYSPAPGVVEFAFLQLQEPANITVRQAAE